MTAEKPKPSTFFIRGLQMTTVVERMFHVDSAAERAGWLEAIERVKKKLDEVRLTRVRGKNFIFIINIFPNNFEVF